MFSVLFGICAQYIGMDLGSEYIKTAESTIMGDPKMRFSPNGGNFRAAAAIRKPEVVKNYEPNVDVETAQLRFGKSALNTLKHHPENGFEYLPRAIARDNTSFRTSNIISPREMMTLYIQDYLRQFPAAPNFVIAVPAFWTHEMRLELTTICREAGMQLVDIIDDKTAVASHYAAINYNRFQKKSRNVLFIDAGATSFKAYGYVFGTNGDTTFANETVYTWTEAGGTYHLAKEIAAAKKISMKKAMKFLLERKPGAYINNVSTESTNILRTAIEAYESFSEFLKTSEIPDNSGVIDEVQVFGGPSRLDYFTKAIKRATNQTKLYYEFNQNEAIAKGIIYHRAMVDGAASVPCKINNVPTTDLILSTEDKAFFYCRRTGGCAQRIHLHNATNAKTLRVFVPEDQLPEGASPVQFYCELKNLTNFKAPEGVESVGQVYFRVPQPEIIGVQWCANNTCQPIEAIKYQVTNNHKPICVNFTLAAMEASKNKKLLMIEYSRVEEIISSISAKIEQFLERKKLTMKDIPEDLLITYNKYHAMLEDGTLMEKSIEGLRDAQVDLKINAKHITDRLNKIKSKKSTKKAAAKESAKSEKTKKATDEAFDDLKKDFAEDDKEL